MHVFKCALNLTTKAKPLLWGGQGAVPPLMSTCASPFWFTQNTVFGTLRNDKTKENDGKRNNYVQT